MRAWLLVLLAVAACEQAKPAAHRDAAPVAGPVLVPAADAERARPDAAPAIVERPAVEIVAPPRHPIPHTQRPVAPADAEPFRCPRMPACGIGCRGPMAKDEHGCTLCACEDVGL